jgi:hypothetical protein
MSRYQESALGLTLLARSARACVTCDSQTAHAVRGGIFNGEFAHTLLLTAAPFPLFVLLAVLIYRYFPVQPQEQL